MDEQSKSLLVSVGKKWKAEVDRGAKDCQIPKAKPCALVALKAKSYRAAIQEFVTWLLAVDPEPVEGHIARRVAINLVNHGFTSWSHLNGLVPEDFANLNLLPADVALLARAIAKACRVLEAEHTVLPTAASGCNLPLAPEVRHNKGADADVVAASFSPEVLQQAENEWFKEANSIGVAGLGVSLTPAAAISALGTAKLSGHCVQPLLEQRVATLKRESNKKSLASVACGLKSWHAFAVSVLNYSHGSTLPPSGEMDVMKFLTIFRNPATGSNYVGYLKWACVYLGFSTAWFGEELKLALKGAKKMSLRCSVTSASDRKLLDENLIARVVQFADSRGFQAWSCMALVAWEFLLRVQSEAIGLQNGCPPDATALPPERHSGMWVDASGALVLRLQRRKHRPKGSLLRRRCMCSKVGRQLCVVHRMEPLLQAGGPGANLFAYTAYEFQALLRKFLGMLRVEGAQQFTLKTFRAGKATSLAMAGAPLGQLLAAGEWRSRAILNYVDEDAFDGAAVVAAEIEASDCE